MPWRNPTPCTTPGCSGLARAGRGQCTECISRGRKQRAAVTSAYDDPAWVATSNEYLRQHPWCEDSRCTKAATEVHHIDGRGPRGPRGHDWSNLQALCKRHHSQRTAQMTGFHRRQ